MKIEFVELRLVQMPLTAPFETSFGREVAKECILVKLAVDGVVGWGECVAMERPWYSYETNGTAWHVIKDYILPGLLGQELADRDEVRRRTAWIRGHNMARAAIETAFWDALARREGISLAQFMGSTQPRIESGVSIGIQETPAKLLKVIDGYLQEGYRRIKIKIKPGWDAAVTRQVREAFPQIRLQVDANSAYTLADAPIFREMEDLNLLLIEQPLAHDDIIDHARLQAQVKVPICLDESIHSTEDARKAIELGACQVINIKQGRVGGLGEALAMHDLCRERGVPVWCGGMLETGIGRAVNCALASLPGFTLPGDVSASDRFYVQDIVEPPFTISADGWMTVPTAPGIGVTVQEDRVERITVHRETFKP